MLAVAYATGRASHARQVKGDDPDKKGHPGPPAWGFGVGLTTAHSKNLLLRKLNKGKRRIFFDRPKPTAGCSANGRRRICMQPLRRADHSFRVLQSVCFNVCDLVTSKQETQAPDGLQRQKNVNTLRQLITVYEGPEARYTHDVIIHYHTQHSWADVSPQTIIPSRRQH
jgi:hypothetical protein